MQSVKSNPYALTFNDYQLLGYSTITPEMADKLGIYRVNDIVGRQEMGKDPKYEQGRSFAGIIFPYISPFTGYEHIRRLRRDTADFTFRTDGTTKEDQKYSQHWGDRTHLYYPMLVSPELFKEWLMDDTIPIVFTEGEKKAACLMRIALDRMGVESKPPFIPIGLEGVYGYYTTIGTELQPDGTRDKVSDIQHDLIQIPLKNRHLIILYDADIHTNPKVRGAARTFALLMMHEGAKAKIAEIPQDTGLKACDDIAYSLGDEAVLEIMRMAMPYRGIRPTRESIADKLNRAAVLKSAVLRLAAIENTDIQIQAQKTLGVKTYRKLSVLWSQAGQLEAKERDLLFTLHALAEGETSIDFYYRDLYRLLYRYEGNETDNCINQRIRRRFDALFLAEAKAGMSFVRLTPGARVDGEFVPSRIELLSMEHINSIDDLASVDPDFGRNKQAAFERAAQTLAYHLSGKPMNRKHKKNKNIYIQIKDGWKRVGGNLRATIERMQKEGFEDEAIGADFVKMICDYVAIELLEAENFKTAIRQGVLNELREASQVTPSIIYNKGSLSSIVKREPDVSGRENEALEVSDDLVSDGNEQIFNVKSEALEQSLTPTDAIDNFAPKTRFNKKSEMEVKPSEWFPKSDLSTDDLADLVFDDVFQIGGKTDYGRAG